jgi:deoxyribodipyrimidine photo-lyase
LCVIVYWHKRDLRLLDNSALVFGVGLAREYDCEFLPIVGLETDLITDPKTAYEFSDLYKFGFISALIPLVKNYKYFGIEAHVFYEKILDFLTKINRDKPIIALVSHQEHGTQNTFARDKAVAQFCKNHGIIWYQIASSGVIRNLTSRDGRDKLVKEYLNGKILKIPIFEGVKNSAWQNNNTLIKLFTEIQSQIGQSHNLQSTSEKSALNCLESFTIERAANYRGGISSPNKAMDSGSRLSQYLAFGTVSLRYVTQYFWTQVKCTKNKKIRAGILGAMQRLHWREHFIQRLESDPNMPNIAIHPDYDKISYNNQHFESYKLGKSGEPLVDACIRCLLQTGFVNFRMRAMIVSYGVFGLDIDWRDLGRFLATVFYDYEPGIHWSQIQMQSGVTGINTIRVYSPHKQLLDQDSDCVFVKKWIPELRELSVKQIQNYTKNNLQELTNGKYPKPIVDFKIESKANKAKTYGIRKDATKESSQKVYIKHGSRKPRTKK